MLRLVLAGLALALAAAGTAVAAPTLAPSVVGEPPQGAGVFRFPQAVAVTPGGGTVFVGDQYSGVVQAFDATGTFRFAFGARATRREAGRLGVVGGIATDRSGHVYVLDAENERVQVFAASDGHPLSAFGDGSIFDLVGGDPTTGAGISASGIAVAQTSAGAAPVVYVADQGRDRVARFVLDPTSLTPTGSPTFSGPDVDLQAPQGLALDPGGTRLYVADDDHHRVLVLDPTTLTLLGGVGTFGTGPAQFQNPYDVAVDGDDPMQLYVADNLNNRIDVFDALSLSYLRSYGRAGYGPGVGNFEIVRSVGALTDVPGGGVLVADTANNRVQGLDAAGNVTSAWGIAGRGAGYVTRPGGVALAPNGGVTVADSFDQRIALFDPDGTFVGLRGLVSPITGFASAGPAAGQFSLPSGVAYDAAGNLWVADTGNDRVVELDPGGAVLSTTPAGLLSGPLDVATGSAGTYVADTGHGAVKLIAPGGILSTVRSGLAHPAAVAVAPDGTVYVADDTSVRNAFTGATVTGPSGPVWDHPTGLAVDGAGTLYVSERRPGTAAGARIVRGTLSGTGWETLAPEGPGDGEVIEPGGLAVTADGTTLLVADAGNNRVLRLDAPGHGPAPRATLKVAVDQPARGTVMSDLPGIACVTDCRQTFGAGRSLTLTARPAAGSILSTWTGACAPAGAAPTCSLTMSADQTVGAVFAAAPPPPVTPPPPPPPAPVQISGMRLSTHVLHRARARDVRRRRPARRATRAQVTVTLTVPASLAIGMQQGRPGRRQGSRCDAVTRANRRRGRCTRYVTLRRSRAVPIGTTTVRFSLTPSFAGAALPPGSYRLAVSALDAAGNRVGPRTADVRVTR